MKDPNYFHVYGEQDLPALKAWLLPRNFTDAIAPDNLKNKKGLPMVALRLRVNRPDGRVNDKRAGLMCFESAELKEKGIKIIQEIISS